MKFDAFLFDLDGTLVDSAPDLAYALNQTLLKNGKCEKEFKDIRKLVSKGGKALIKFGFGIDDIYESDENFKKYHTQLLEIYTKNIAKHSKLFIDREFLNSVEWGIVTNKPTNLTHLLLKELNLSPKVIVCGDTLSENKPSGKPTLFAMESLKNKNIVFVGDDINDMQSAKNAKIPSIAVSYGYGKPSENWDYDFLIDNPKDIYQFKI
jgi:HAD superfamily hydrolase (TIGR01549 family)